MSREIVDQANAVPSWLHLGPADAGISAGVARGLNLALASVLASAGVWLLAGAGDAPGPAPVLDVAPETPDTSASAPAPEGGPPAKAADPGREASSSARDEPPDEPPPTEGPAKPPGTDPAADPAKLPTTDPKHRDPAAAATLVERGEQALKSGKRSSARRLFEEALVLDPANAAALMGLSNLSFDAGNYPSAERYAREAVELEPRNADYRLRLGDAYFKLGQTARARTHYQRAQKLGHPFAAARLARLPK